MLKGLKNDLRQAKFNLSVSECRIRMMESINQTIPSNADEFAAARLDLEADQAEVNRIESQLEFRNEQY